MTLGPDYFAERYVRRDDPWRLAAPWYEERKRALTAAILPRARFATGLEIGCSIGLLTEVLATRCDRLLAVDIAERAIELARERVSTSTVVGRGVVEFAVMATPEQWPVGRFDLVVVSEVGYYLDERDLAILVRRIEATLSPDGVVVACHWRHPVAEYPTTGDRVHEVLRGLHGFSVLAEYRDADLVLEVLAPAATESVASVDGLV